MESVEKLMQLANEARDAKDYEKALEYYRQAAEQGNGEAMNELGDFYKMGKGVEKDTTQAIYWFEKSVETGEALAMLNLGVLYEDERFDGHDEKKAAAWLCTEPAYSI